MTAPSTTERTVSPAYLPDGPCPGEQWEERTPEALGLRRESLDALAAHVRGRGVVVRRGYLAYHWGEHTLPGDLASARKPIISTMLLCAVQEGLIPSPNEALDRYVPGLREINGGKDAAITWKHLASQTSGYGWSERPGEAWSYNDFALALYVDTLFDRALKLDPTAALRRWVSGPLQLEDDSHFNAEIRPDVRRKGRIAMSPRDHARFGLFYLRGGAWHGKQLLRRDLVDEALASVVPADLPATAGIDADMLPGQESHGGGKRTNARGPGQYSYNWWLNLPDKNGRPLFPDAPPDAIVGIGLGMTRGLWIIPSLDLVVAWQGANWSEDDKVNPGEPQTPHNVAAKLLTEACGG